MNFIWPHLEGLSIDLILNCEERLSQKYPVYDFMSFVHYKLSRAVKMIFRKHKLNNFTQYSPLKSTSQLRLALELNFGGYPGKYCAFIF